MELKELLCALEERLVQHDNNRKEIQDKIQEICSKITEEANSLEEKLSEELQESFNLTEEHILNLIEKLNNNISNEEESNDNILIKEIQEELSITIEYGIQHTENTDNFVNSYKLNITRSKTIFIIGDKNESENNTNQLREHLNKIHDSVISAQDKLIEICTKRRNKAEEVKKRINNELETLFTKEDSRIQEIMSILKEKNSSNNGGISEELKTKAKLTLFANQKYSLNKDDNNEYSLIITKETSLKWLDFEERKPSNIITSFTSRGEFSLFFTFFSDDEINVMKSLTKLKFNLKIKVWDKSKNENINPIIITTEYIINENKLICFPEPLYPSTTYCIKIQIEHQKLSSKWSDIFEFITPEFKEYCVWKECPDYVYDNKKYSIDENNPRIVTNITGYECTIIGNTSLPLNKVTFWNIKILKSKNDGYGNIFIGITPFDINQNKRGTYRKYGWYFGCYSSSLCSGPPHKYKWKEYGSRKEKGNYVHTGDSVGVVMNTINGDLSFVLNGVNLGVAFKDIPLDKPLVPCVILEINEDSVELDTSLFEIKERLNTNNCIIS